MGAAITVIGLGAGDENQLTIGAVRKLESAGVVYLRTAQHPVVSYLSTQGIPIQAFDEMYEAHSSFEQVYEAIVSKLVQLAKAENGEVVYAVPGHPSVAERTTQLLMQKCQKEGVAFSNVGGSSFLDQVFTSFAFDPIEGFQLLDAGSLSPQLLNPGMHTVIAQVYDAFSASDVKLSLMELYPDDYPVQVAHALGVSGSEQIIAIPLYELDRIQGYGNLSLVYVPPSDDESVTNRSFARLHEIVGILRSPDGCPWDREQTHQSLRKNLIEETYEVLETLDDDDPTAMCEELGDLLLQVMLHAQMEEETGSFTVYDIIQGLNEKLIRRHPHVFGNQRAGDSEEALQHWNEVKSEEKRNSGLDLQTMSALSGVPRDLPSLMKAYKLQKKAAQVGFDWERIEDVLAKVEEELQELRAEIQSQGSDERKQSELGDLLFAVVNLSRFIKADPEQALSGTNQKFIQRFSYIEQQVRLRGGHLEQTSLIEMERYWEEAKNFS